MPARNNRDENGFTYVILGLILGFFLGSGIVYWFSNRHNDSMLAYKTWNYLARLFQGNEKTGAYMVSETELDHKTTEPNKPKSTGRMVSGTGYQGNDSDAGSTFYVEDNVTFEQPDSIVLDEFFPELAQPSNDETNHGNTDTTQFISSSLTSLRVAQDRLIMIRAYNLPPTFRMSPQNQTIRQLDSLLGNYPRRSSNENMLLVEFWQSPLNFRGYKMSPHKLIVYGFDMVEAFSLHSDGKSFFIKYFDNIYPVSPTLQFRQLTPLVDPVLLEEFKQRWP